MEGKEGVGAEGKEGVGGFILLNEIGIGIWEEGV